MVSKEEVFKYIIDGGLSTPEKLEEAYKVVWNDSLIVHPGMSEEQRTAYILTIILGRVKGVFGLGGFFIGYGDQFDVNVKARKRALQLNHYSTEGSTVGKLIYKDMPTNQNFREGEIIPTEAESLSRLCYGVFWEKNKEGKIPDISLWKPFSLWLRETNDVFPLFTVLEFRATGKITGTTPTLNSDGISYKIVKDEKINFPQIAKLFLKNNITTLKDLPNFQKVVGFPIEIINAQVVRFTKTSPSKKADVVELRSYSRNIEELDTETPNYTLFINKQLDLDLHEGDIVWCVVDKFTGRDGSIGVRGYGFWIEESNAPISPPQPLTIENISTNSPIIEGTTTVISEEKTEGENKEETEW